MMADEQSKQRLGRGLAALIGEMDRSPVPQAAAEESQSETLSADGHVPIEKVVANRNNPRRTFAASDLEDLANSIAEHGIVQPVLVRRSGDDGYELIAGERRWRAAQRAGLHEIPVVIRDVDDRQSLELAIIENVQRADLNPIEEATGYQQLMDDHGYNQAELGKVIGKSRSHVANTLRLLRLPDSVRTMLADGALSSGHARTLITLDHPEQLAKRIVEENLSVRAAETLANRENRGPAPETKSAKPSQRIEDADTRALQSRLRDHLGLTVKIKHRVDGKGQLVIDYTSLEQLDTLVAKLER